MSEVVFDYEADKAVMLKRLDFLPDDDAAREAFFNNFITLMFHS